MDSVEIDKSILDTSYPLLDKFKDIAPGTFKHCQHVSMICESIAIELGLNIDLLRCAALYHDIGKMNNPLYFSENQSDTNIHDELDPYVSYQMITRHVGDSVLKLLNTPGIPVEVLQIISQHHGDNIMKVFFDKSESALENEYRYKCEKPQSTEASILMIVDSCEAMVRAVITNGNQDKETHEIIEDSVTKIIDKFIDDSQLDNMQIGTLKVAKRIIIKELDTVYHKRVPYDEKETVGKKKTDNEKIDV